MNAAADTTLVDTLIRNLKDLRKSAEAGVITGDPTPYGLDKPTATLTVSVNTGNGRERAVRSDRRRGDRQERRTPALRAAARRRGN